MQWALLASLPSADQRRILDAARRRRFGRGEIVFHEGDPADSLHLVESGIFAVQVSDRTGDKATLNVLGSGGFFGELALVQDVQTPRRSATVLALVPGQTLTITRTAFTAMRNSSPGVERLVVAALAHRVEELSERLLEALYVGVDRRVYRRLVELGEIYGGSGSDIVIPLSQADVATMAGASRPTVNQVLQRLVGRGIISLGRREITVRDLAALREVAQNLDS
jgi:CRP-like cAMP-binding protein